MDNKKNALGRGLAALIPNSPTFNEEGSQREPVQLLNLNMISPNRDQPRRYFDAEKIGELAASIQELGILQPIIVVKLDEDDYQIVAGERRYRAAGIAGLKQIPCIVRVQDEKQIRELSLIENIQREDLKPMEEAEAYLALQELYNYTQEDLAKRLGKSRPYIANMLRLNSLPSHYKELLNQRKISAGHARAILPIESDRDQAEVVKQIMERNLSVRQTEELVRKYKEKEETAAKQVKPADKAQQAIYDDIAKRLKNRLGVKVKINGNQNKGQVVIDYYSDNDLSRIIDTILDD